jgi:hypothetical protein
MRQGAVMTAAAESSSLAEAVKFLREGQHGLRRM